MISLLATLGLVQERQSIIKYWLDNLRAKHGEVLHNINFLEGQPISKLLVCDETPDDSFLTGFGNHVSRISQFVGADSFSFVFLY